MDKFAKRYTLILVVALLAALAWWFFSRDTVAGDINAKLASDAELAAYPYAFRVVSVDNGIATASSPRAARVPVMQFLREAFPELASVPVDHPDMMAAQDALVTVQSRAAEIIRSHPDVRSVRWQLDEAWYAKRGVYLDSGR